MQRAILDALDEVGVMHVHDPEGQSWRYCSFRDSQDAEVDVSHIYAVGQVRHHLADMMHKTRWLYGWDNTTGTRKPQWGRTRQVPDFGFTASFSRALYGLIARQLLRPVWRYGLQVGRVEYVCKC
jgi:hypothetical protein